jgi:hypothetical protein
MAGIIYNPPGGANVNPTSTFIPLNIAGTFIDSCLVQDNDNASFQSIKTIDNNANDWGLIVAPTSLQVQLGDYQTLGNGTVFTLDDSAADISIFAYNNVRLTTDATGTIILNTGPFVLNISSIRINGPVTAGSAGLPSGQFLMININGTAYKINLLLP